MENISENYKLTIMKELTIEEKAQRYDKALERMISWVRGEHPECFTEAPKAAEFIFPELKESEDEKIRKKLISFVENWDKGGIVSKYTSNANDIKRILAWLEKQGEKPQGKSALEAIKEEKVDDANKVEPKFHEGEWITDGCLHCKISDVLDDRYIVDTKFGKRSAIPFKRENNYHLWSIQDAKDGDILIYNDSIFIFDEIYENDLIYYGIYEHNKFHNDKYYSFLDLNTININNIYPATKEQRDTLEKAMTDAGYTFDFEKKELKKLGQSEVTKTSDQEEIAEIPFGAKDSELQEATYFIPKGFYAEIDDDKVVIKKGEKPATWSEEDELSCFESALFTAFSDAWQSYLLGEEVNVKQWTKEHSKELLEAAKEELKGHNSAWSEEDTEISSMLIELIESKVNRG